MVNFTESQLERWASPPSQSEADRMANAERAIRNAIAASDKLRAKDIKIFAQGSYRNRVNVRQDSDVDIAVLCTNTYYYEGLCGTEAKPQGWVPATYDFAEFRDDVQTALNSHFGASWVTPGDKAFDVKSNTYRVEADVAPFFEHRRYSSATDYISGVEMRPRSGGSIINWPDQHYSNGVWKNDQTKRSFKGCVRILKSLRYLMIGDGIKSAKEATCFLMECLVWNVPNTEFGYSTWEQEIRSCLAFLFNKTRNDADSAEWGEVSDLKYLFRWPQPWTRPGAHQFLSDCWDYIGFE